MSDARNWSEVMATLAQLQKRVEILEKVERPISVSLTAYTITYLGGTTPGTTTYTSQTGQYIRIGPLVVASGTLVWTAATGTGNAQISLPLAAVTANYSGAARLINVTFANSTPTIELAASQSFFLLHSPATNAAGAYVQMEAAGNLVFTVAYFV